MLNEWEMSMKYCEAIYQTKRRPTRVVMVGNVGVGGENRIRIQSMTTSNTRDVAATIDQAMRLADAGCEIVRVTVQGMKEADACEGIKNGLLQRGYHIPLVADIHFYPPAAMRVIDFVDKVRINPGNFVDKRATFKQIEYDDESYAQEILKIEEKFAPLVEKCKRLKRAMRIGTNHGSLSDRIMNRYGDTPAGMVESALEFARICRKMDYHDIIFSMKASNPQVMIQAYRLLTAAMYEVGWNYPLHLGVTEAGEGEDGRVKSAMGIGTLLLDGIGDTIRVSLTEDPWFEIDPCQRLIRLAEVQEGKGIEPFDEERRSIDKMQRRSVHFDAQVPLHRNGTIFLTVPQQAVKHADFFQQIGCEGSFDRPTLKSMTVDNLVLREFNIDKEATQRLQQVREIGVGIFSPNPGVPSIPIVTLSDAMQAKQQQARMERFALHPFQPTMMPLIIKIEKELPIQWDALVDLKPALIILSPFEHRLHYCRQFFEWLQVQKLDIPVILHFSYQCTQEDVTLLASMECGALLCDGLGEGIWLEGPYSLDFIRQLSFSILQAARMRMSKTDFISCPSCGRTLFDLQDVTKRIQKRTSHLPGVKIAIMGCIVNGPGEMADADFGYVGSKLGKIDLYVGKTCVERDIDFSEAEDRLVALIQAHGRWIEPVQDTLVSNK
jgi:(E)-4-hydroxy-3-methylbut-2-enyl-diphosphate synthase